MSGPPRRSREALPDAAGHHSTTWQPTGPHVPFVFPDVLSLLEETLVAEVPNLTQASGRCAAGQPSQSASFPCLRASGAELKDVRPTELHALLSSCRLDVGHRRALEESGDHSNSDTGVAVINIAVTASPSPSATAPNDFVRSLCSGSSPVHHTLAQCIGASARATRTATVAGPSVTAGGTPWADGDDALSDEDEDSIAGVLRRVCGVEKVALVAGAVEASPAAAPASSAGTAPVLAVVHVTQRQDFLSAASANSLTPCVEVGYLTRLVRAVLRTCLRLTMRGSSFGDRVVLLRFWLDLDGVALRALRTAWVDAVGRYGKRYLAANDRNAFEAFSVHASSVKPEREPHVRVAELKLCDSPAEAADAAGSSTLGAPAALTPASDGCTSGVVKIEDALVEPVHAVDAPAAAVKSEEADVPLLLSDEEIAQARDRLFQVTTFRPPDSEDPDRPLAELFGLTPPDTAPALHACVTEDPFPPARTVARWHSRARHAALKDLFSWAAAPVTAETPEADQSSGPSGVPVPAPLPGNMSVLFYEVCEEEASELAHDTALRYLFARWSGVADLVTSSACTVPSSSRTSQSCGATQGTATPDARSTSPYQRAIVLFSADAETLGAALRSWCRYPFPEHAIISHIFGVAPSLRSNERPWPRAGQPSVRLSSGVQRSGRRSAPETEGPRALARGLGVAPSGSAKSAESVTAATQSAESREVATATKECIVENQTFSQVLSSFCAAACVSTTCSVGIYASEAGRRSLGSAAGCGLAASHVIPRAKWPSKLPRMLGYHRVLSSSPPFLAQSTQVEHARSDLLNVLQQWSGLARELATYPRRPALVVRQQQGTLVTKRHAVLTGKASAKKTSQTTVMTVGLVRPAAVQEETLSPSADVDYVRSGTPYSPALPLLMDHTMAAATALRGTALQFLQTRFTPPVFHTAANVVMTSSSEYFTNYRCATVGYLQYALSAYVRGFVRVSARVDVYALLRLCHDRCDDAPTVHDELFPLQATTCSCTPRAHERVHVSAQTGDKLCRHVAELLLYFLGARSEGGSRSSSVPQPECEERDVPLVAAQRGHPVPVLSRAQSAGGETPQLSGGGASKTIEKRRRKRKERGGVQLVQNNPSQATASQERLDKAGGKESCDQGAAEAGRGVPLKKRRRSEDGETAGACRAERRRRKKRDVAPADGERAEGETGDAALSAALERLRTLAEQLGQSVTTGGPESRQQRSQPTRVRAGRKRKQDDNDHVQLGNRNAEMDSLTATRPTQESSTISPTLSWLSDITLSQL